MIQTLIVDDQEEIIRGIQSGVAWHEIPEIEMVYHALSAADAKTVFLNHEINLLITDIEMPGESGLELVSWVNEKYPETKCIVLTAHAKFDYAQDAIRLHCEDYILQPVKYDILQEAVEKAVAQIVKDQELQEELNIGSYWSAHRSKLERKTWEDYLTGRESSLADLKSQLESQNIALPLGEGFGLVIVYHLSRQQGLDEWSMQTAVQEEGNSLISFLAPYSGYQCIFSQEEGIFSLLFTSGLPKEECFDLLQAFAAVNEEELALYFDYDKHLENLPFLYQELEADFRLVLMPKPGVYHRQTSQREEPGELPNFRSWVNCFEQKTTQYILDSIKDCMERNIRRGTMNRATIFALQQAFLYAFQESLRKRALSFAKVMADSEAQTAFSLSLRSTTEFMSFAALIIEKNKELPSQGEEESEDAVALARTYIADHLSDSGLSRQEIAKSAHISESHLSHLFSKRLELSITDYVNSERLKLAKSLLADTSMPITLIAMKSGYNSASYFISTFKKNVGVTPTEYRKRQKA